MEQSAYHALMFQAIADAHYAKRLDATLVHKHPEFDILKNFIKLHLRVHSFGLAGDAVKQKAPEIRATLRLVCVACRSLAWRISFAAVPIPPLNELGLLPAGVHDCTPDELKAHFGSFQQSDRRPQLCAKLESFVSEAKASRIVRQILVDGSFVTAKPDPNDIDLILIVAAEHDSSAELGPAEYNVVSKRHVHRRFGFDLLLARENSLEQSRWTEFFQEVRLEPGRRKGILRLRL